MTTTQDTTRALEELGFSLFCGAPQPGLDDNWPHIAFQVVLNYKGKQAVTTPYKLGIGHVDVKKAKPDGILQPSFDHQCRAAGIRSKRQNEHCATVRCSFVDWLDSMVRDGQVSEKLAQRATL